VSELPAAASDDYRCARLRLSSPAVAREHVRVGGSLESKPTSVQHRPDGLETGYPS
jgi:hypothetical protein